MKPATIPHRRWMRSGPLYPEYLAQLPKEEALGGLQDIAPILALLGARLQQRESRYAVLFDLLVKLANAAVDSEKVAEKIADEAPRRYPTGAGCGLGRRAGEILC